MDELIFDPFGLEPVDRAIVLETAERYVEVRCKVRALARAGQPFRVIVKEPNLWDWFEDIQNESTVSVKVRDPIQELRRSLNGEQLPSWLTSNPALVVEWSLIERARTKPPLQTVEDWILATCVSRFWSRPSLAANDVPGLLKAIHDCDWERLGTPLRMLLAERLSQWAQSSELSSFIGWLGGGDMRARAIVFDLAQRVVNYPYERVTVWLTPHGLAELTYLEDWRRWAAKFPVPEIPDTCVPEQIRAGVASYIINTVTTNPEQLCLVLSHSRGLIPSEVSAYKQIFSSWTRAITTDVVEAFSRLFPGQTIAEVALEYLEVPAPRNFPDGATPDAAVKWAMESYLPYYRWSRAIHRPELTVPHVSAFEQWYLANGHSMDPIQWSILGLLDHAEAFASPGVLVVVIDGLGAEWTSDLLRELALHNLHPAAHVNTRFSIPPTITEYAKPALVRGQQPRQIGAYENSTRGYRALLEARLQGIDVVEVINEVDREIDLVGLVSRRPPGNRNIYLFLANRLDSILHSPAVERQRRNRGREYLQGICEQIEEACVHYSDVSNRKLTVIVTADHGHTILPAGTEELQVPEGGEMTHFRAVKLPVGSHHEFPGAYFLSPGPWGLPEPLLVAEGYRCFESRPRGTVHGGILPEEMLVPVVTVQLGAPPSLNVADPFFSLLDRVLRNRPSGTARLRIENPNPVPIAVCTLGLQRVTGISPLIRVPASDHVDVPVQIDSRNLSPGALTLRGSFTLRCQNSEVPGRTAVVTAEIRSAASESTLDDLL